MRTVHRACTALLSVAAVACNSDERLTKDLVGAWTWNPRETLPEHMIVDKGFPTPNLQAFKFDADGQYVHVERVPGYETFAVDRTFQVPEEWFEWKGWWSVFKGELRLLSGLKQDRWAARHEPHGWVLDDNPTDDDRTFNIQELTRGTLRLETKAIGDFDRTLKRTPALPERPVLANPEP